jgi:hypothetical protein
MTLELTLTEHKAFHLISKDDDEKKAIEAPGSMSCWTRPDDATADLLHYSG